MDGTILAALIGVGGLVIVNIIAQAYTYGRLSQKVDDFCGRVERLEKIVHKGV